jgi:hypothetical protein
MPSTNQPFEYQLYFLLFTKRWQGSQHIEEPSTFPTRQVFSSQLLHRRMENDKRLFQVRHRPSTSIDFNINQWILTSWQTIRSHYRNSIIRDTSEQLKPQYDAIEAADALLAGVALVIITAPEKKYPKLDLVFRDEKELALGLIRFEATEEILFQVNDLAGIMTQPAQFISFNNNPVESIKTVRSNSDWQLHFTPQEVSLSPIQHEEDQNHPIFNVYGLTLGVAPLEKRETIVAQLQDLLWAAETGDCVLMDLLTSLLMCQWQAKHIFTAATKVLYELEGKNASFRQWKNEQLRKTPLQKLQKDLQTMTELAAETRYMLSRLQRAIQTLQINADNLRTVLNDWKQGAAEEQTSLTITWEMSSREKWRSLPVESTVLEQDFHFEQEILAARRTYIEGALTHLEGSVLRWQAVLDEHRLNFNKKITTIGYTITAISLIVGLSQVGSVFLAYCEQVACEPKPFWLASWLDSNSVKELGMLFASLLTNPLIFLISILLGVVIVYWLTRNAN